MAVGKIGPFDVSKDNWDTYVDRLDQYFIANNVKSELKIATLITVVGNSAYELMVNLCTPVKPATKTYDELVAVMKGHLNPKPSMLTERFKFRQRIQKPGENVATYFSELKRLSKDCSFTAESLKENMRDQFVCGLVNDDIRQKLFTEEDGISIDKAYRLALAMEAAETNAALVEDGTRRGIGGSAAETASVTVHKVGQDGGNGKRGAFRGGGGGYRPAAGRNTRSAHNSRRSGSGGPTIASGADYNLPQAGTQKEACNVCGGKHDVDTCKFKKYVCRVCMQEGHLRRMCPKLGKNNFVYNWREGGVYKSSDSESDEFQIL
ncbi:uncharacterized protein LOC113508952 [Trichoplusia ni]|uniref:Uncharacterized protein LOC113508952 n=1 Tax=Trichoplusia ni TaxID=7111 RepID=A0A7E5X5R9_TRINI|nr:uncharacterized protein LOC113508952 [Trichoplusia ni]